MLSFFRKLFMTSKIGFNRIWKDPSQLALWPTRRSSRSDDFEGQNEEIRKTPELQDEFININPLGGLLCFLCCILLLKGESRIYYCKPIRTPTLWDVTDTHICHLEQKLRAMEQGYNMWCQG